LSDVYTLDAQARTITGKKVSQLRVQGLVPAVIYGTKIDPINLQVPYRALEVTLLKAGGTHLIDIALPSGTQTVLARAVQRDVITRTILHVDFLAIDKSVAIETDVQIHVVGESPIIASRVGLLQIDLPSLRLSALPSDLVDTIIVDISGLTAVGDVIHVSDLQVPSGVTVLNNADDSVLRIVAVRAAMTDEEIAAAEGPAITEPERIERKKADEIDA